MGSRWICIAFVWNVSRICLERTLASCDNTRVSRMGLEGAEMLSSREAHTGCCKIAPRSRLTPPSCVAAAVADHRRTDLFTIEVSCGWAVGRRRNCLEVVWNLSRSCLE